MQKMRFIAEMQKLNAQTDISSNRGCQTDAKQSHSCINCCKIKHNIDHNINHNSRQDSLSSAVHLDCG